MLLGWLQLRHKPLRLAVALSGIAFAVLLISFMLYVSVYDVGRLPLFGQLLKQKPVIEQTTRPASGN